MMILLRQLGVIGALSILLAFSSPLCAQEAVSSLPNSSPTASANAGNPFVKLAQPSRRPIPVQWKIAIVLAILLIGAGALWISIRVWESARLFDRQYRFPLPENAALRLGGNRSGGHLAMLKFGEREARGENI